MKKIHIVLAVLATAALTSCQQEKSFKELKPLEKNSVAFSINGVSTRAGEAAAPTRRGIIIPLENRLFLEETIQELNPGPATKGTPAYTQNVSTLYPTMGVTSSIAAFNATFGLKDDLGDGWRYSHHYGSVDPWPDNTTPVDFYFNMPADLEGVDDLTGEDGKISFSYSSAELKNAKDQKDILFAYKRLSKKDHDDALPEGAPILMIHALSGVKFAIANYDEEEKITIKEVIFKGIVDSGSCEIAANGTVTWTPGSPSTTQYSSGTFEAPVTFGKKVTETDEDTGEETVTYKGDSFTSMGEYPDSFAAAGNLDNLNDGDASQTFWFVPQAVPANAILTIKYTFGSDEVRTGAIPIGTYLAGVNWGAGQLRTYTIRVDEVNVKIDDDVTIVGDGTDTEEVTDDFGNKFQAVTYRGSSKTNVTITNTGNTDAFIRAAIIGQWLDSSGNPVFGFTDYTIGNVNLVDSWYEDQFVNERHEQGVFAGLPGYKEASGRNGTDYNNWVLLDDGYYYYKEVVAPGKIIGTAPDDATNTSDYLGHPLFTSYTVLAPPAVKVGGEVKNVYFQLEIATQAISAKQWNGETWEAKDGKAAWQVAWENAKNQ